MLAEPKCWTRQCKHYLGVIQPDGTEMTETNSCKAFPDHIPYEIAYGNDLHTTVKKGQVGTFVYEKGERE
ncbi:MAG: hypothetical protein JRJ11_13285 [Deltaproteobacteria bacterium]|nr:hypothetical protein [Deltaproteobacteria bacterium]MBW1910491.1 hypothetical protein [Deltaproteobacteria bacterium]